MAAINITPLVDVVLVMLIIFMVVSPGNPMYVPNAVPKPADIEESAALTSEQLVLELYADGSALLNRNPVKRTEFADAFHKLIETRTDKKLFLAIQDEVPYGQVVDWMGAARAYGASLVAIEIKPPEAAPQPGALPGLPTPPPPAK
jgi:biopolymer transport protein ExbD